MEYQGRILKVLPVQSGTRKSDGTAWQSQEFVFEFFERPEQTWSEKVVLTLFGDRVTENDLQFGDEVVVDFSLDIREYNGRFYNNPHVRALRKMDGQTPTPAPEKAAEAKETATATPTPQPAPEQKPESDGSDDLPF